MTMATWLWSAVAASSLVQPPEQLPVAAVAGAARYRASASLSLLAGELDAASRQAFIRGLAPSATPSAARVWSDVLAGAMQLRREQGGDAQTLWYSPAADLGLLIRWRRTPAGWQAAEVVPILGARLRGEVPAAAMPWLSASDGDLGQALSRSAARSFAAADTGDWARLATLARADAALVAQRLAAIASAQAALRSTSSGRAAIDGVLAEAGGLGAPASDGARAFRASMTRVGERAARSLRPVLAIRRPDGWSLVLQSPDVPALAWLAHFGDPAPGTAFGQPIYALTYLSSGSAGGQR